MAIENNTDILSDKNISVINNHRLESYLNAIEKHSDIKNVEETNFDTDTLEATFGLKRNSQKKIELAKAEDRAKSLKEAQKLYSILEEQDNLQLIVEKAKVPEPLIPLLNEKRDDLPNISESLFLSVKNKVVGKKLQFISEIIAVVQTEIIRKDVFDFYGVSDREYAKKYANITWSPDYYVNSVEEKSSNNKQNYSGFQICAMRKLSAEELAKSHPGSIEAINEKIYRFVSPDSNGFRALNQTLHPTNPTLR